MIERIRYRKYGEHSLISVQTFRHPTNGAEYLVVIHPDGWHIEDPTAGISVVQGRGTTNLRQSKTRARKALEALGVKLQMGVRG